MTNKQFLTNHPPELGDIVVCEGGERWLVSSGEVVVCLDAPRSIFASHLPPIRSLWRPRSGDRLGYPTIESDHLPYWRATFDQVATNTKSESLQRIESAERKLKEAQEELRLAREARE